MYLGICCGYLREIDNAIKFLDKSYLINKTLDLCDNFKVRVFKFFYLFFRVIAKVKKAYQISVSSYLFLFI